MLSEKLPEYMRYPLVAVEGGAITPASLVAGAFVLACFVALAKVLARWMRRLQVAQNLSEGEGFAVSKIIHYVVIGVGSLFAATAVGLHVDTLLAASAVLAVGIGFGFGLQNIAQNFVSGLILLIEQPIRKGDFVKVGDVSGVVTDIGLRATLVVTGEDVTIVVPNNQLITTAVVNRSRPTSSVPISVSAVVAHGSDMNRVEEELLAVAKRNPGVLEGPRPLVLCEGFNGSGISVILLAWVGHPSEDGLVASRLRLAALAAFRAAQIQLSLSQTVLVVPPGQGAALDSKGASSAESGPSAPPRVAAAPAARATR